MIHNSLLESLKFYVLLFLVCRLRPTAADIPATLVEYLQSWLKCLCGRICYESHILTCISLNLKLVAPALTIGNAFETSTPALATLCSQKCFDKFTKR